jgi:hypothetical protein
MSAIQNELLGAVSIKRRNNEPEQKFWARLAEAVRELQDDDWENLSKPAQTWTNRAIKALNKEIDIPEFPDTVRDQEEAQEDDEDVEDKLAVSQNGEDDESDVNGDEDDDDDRRDDDEDDEEEVLRTKSKTKPLAKIATEKPKARKPMVAKKKEKPTPKKVVVKGDNGAAKHNKQGPDGPGNTCQTLIKKLYLKDTEITTDEMVKQLKDAGWKPTRQVITTQLSGFRHSIRVLRDVGLITKRFDI